MAARPRVLCVGDHLETTVEELRGSGFDVMVAPNAQAARALIHLYPPAAVLGGHDEIQQIHQAHPRISAVLMLADTAGKIPPHSATDKVHKVLGKRKEMAAG